MQKCLARASNIFYQCFDPNERCKKNSLFSGDSNLRTLESYVFCLTTRPTHLALKAIFRDDE